jgi:hypothetical protein
LSEHNCKTSIERNSELILLCVGVVEEIHPRDVTDAALKGLVTVRFSEITVGLEILDSFDKLHSVLDFDSFTFGIYADNVTGDGNDGPAYFDGESEDVAVGSPFVVTIFIDKANNVGRVTKGSRKERVSAHKR